MKAALNKNFYIIFIPGREFLYFHITAFELKGDLLFEWETLPHW